MPPPPPSPPSTPTDGGFIPDGPISGRSGPPPTPPSTPTDGSFIPDGPIHVVVMTPVVAQPHLLPHPRPPRMEAYP